MTGMERFTQRARRVLSLAHQEAERMRHHHIGTEHLLLGLIREEGGVAGVFPFILAMPPRYAGIGYFTATVHGHAIP